MSGTDDVFDIQDLRALLGRATDGAGGRVAVAVVLAVVGASLALALVPHALGAVGANAVDTGGGIGADDVDGEEAQQRYQNYLTDITFLFAPALLATVGVLAAFAGAVRATGSRAMRVAAVTVAAGVGVAVGYVLFVLVGHLAYGETSQGFVVEAFPVTLRFGALATNALSLGASAALGSALAGVAGSVVGRDDDRRPAGASTAPAGVDADGDREWVGVDPDAEDESAAASADDRDATADGSDPGDGAGAAGGDEGASDGAATGPASDYRDTAPTRDSDAPQYDPDDRDWDGSSGD